jgi:anthranilate phosphoribosyltransferase
VLEGERGPHRDIVVLNAGAALLVSGAVEDLAAGVAQAAATIDDGRAAAALERLRAVSVAASVAAAEGDLPG